MTKPLEIKIPLECLLEIKLSIIKNANDVLYLENFDGTVCERIDDILAQNGYSEEELEKHYLLGMGA